jgi:hypothetical protein
LLIAGGLGRRNAPGAGKRVTATTLRNEKDPPDSLQKITNNNNYFPIVPQPGFQGEIGSMPKHLKIA